MSGSKAGAAKAHETKIKKYGNDFYKNIGSKSWDNERSHETGFALLSEEERRELGAKGGSKTKKEYKNKKTSTDTETEKTSTGVSE